MKTFLILKAVFFISDAFILRIMINFVRLIILYLLNMCCSLKPMIRGIGLFLIMALMPSDLIAENYSADAFTPNALGNVETKSMDSCQYYMDMASDDEDEYTIKTMGDIDGDHDVDVSDIMMIVQYLLTEDSSNIDKRDADVTWDGEISINDVMMLVNIVMGDRPSAPVYVPLF